MTDLHNHSQNKNTVRASESRKLTFLQRLSVMAEEPLL